MKIPDQYLPVMPYLILNDTAAFRHFMAVVFGAAEQLIVPAKEQDIIHGELKINNAVIMFASASEKWPEKTAGMYIYVEEVDKTYERAINHGAKSLMPPTKQEYGYSGGFEDPFGNHWWIVAPTEN